MLFLNSKRLYEQKIFFSSIKNLNIPFTNLHQPLNSCNGCNYPRKKRSMAQIMAVTGHKSASSVAGYQRVSSKETQVMGDIITSSVRGEQPSQLL